MSNIAFGASTPFPAEPAKPQDIVQPGDETVTMVFSRDVLLTLQTGARVQFRRGIQEVPAGLVDHPYLKLSGAVRYEKAVSVVATEATPAVPKRTKKNFQE